MNRLLFALMVMVLGFFSCNKEVQPLSKEEVRQKTDSLIKVRKQESDEQAKIDLEHRIKIEVKVKVDSILNARAQQAANDTLKKKSPQVVK